MTRDYVKQLYLFFNSDEVQSFHGFGQAKFPHGGSVLGLS